jgi:carbamoyl-phosphate synthase large subunit
VVALAKALNVVGLMNTQFAITFDEEGKDTVYLIEVNPRASRTVPFVSKATGMPLAKIAARCMVGQTLAEQGATKEIIPSYYSVKEAIFPFAKFQGVDPILGPEMRSTGEVMGVGRNFGAAMARAQEAGGIKALPASGKVFVSVRDPDKKRVLPVAQDLVKRGYALVATEGTHAFLTANGIECERINKVLEGRPHIVDLIKNGEIVYIINTTEGRQAITDSFSIRREALQQRVTYSTTVSGARALVNSLDYRGTGPVWSLQELHAEVNGAA